MQEKTQLLIERTLWLQVRMDVKISKKSRRGERRREKEWKNEGVKEWKNEGVKEWRSERMKEWRSERMKEWKNERMKEAKYSYKNLEAYKESKTLVKQVYTLLKQFPREEQYALCDQLRRAVISVPSNIAEGSGRTSAKDQAHFFEMAFGSLMEVDCQIDIALDLSYVSSEEHEDVSKQISQVAALLSGMRRKILSVEWKIP